MRLYRNLETGRIFKKMCDVYRGVIIETCDGKEPQEIYIIQSDANSRGLFVQAGEILETQERRYLFEGLPVDQVGIKPLYSSGDFV